MILNIKQDKMRELVSNWIPDDNSTIIEIGCSSGNFAELISKRKLNYIGVDILSKKINEAREKNPNMNFMNCDITKNLHILKQASIVVAFQCFEHIQDDLKIIKAISLGTLVIFSVPNRKYKGHVRWFEIDGWTERFSPYINLERTITIQHPKKPNSRSFLFKGEKSE